MLWASITGWRNKVQWARIGKAGPSRAQVLEKLILQEGIKESTAALIHKTKLGEEMLYAEMED